MPRWSVYARRPLNLAIRHTERKGFVAIKILKASMSQFDYKSNVYSQLTDKEKLSKHPAAGSPSTAESPPWTQFIVPLLSSFTHFGPNGNHTCLVFEPMGCSVSDLLEQRSRDAHSQKMSAPAPVNRGLKTRQAKSTLRQMLAALVVLHSSGLIHGDLHAGKFFSPYEVYRRTLKATLPFSCRKITRMNISPRK